MSLTLSHVNIYPQIKLNVIKLVPCAYNFEVLVLAPIPSSSFQDKHGVIVCA